MKYAQLAAGKDKRPGGICAFSRKHFEATHTAIHVLSHITFKFLAGVVLAFAVTGPSMAQEAQSENAEGRPQASDDFTIQAVRVLAPLSIDGLMNEESWTQAEPVTRFLQKDPQEGAPASEGTEVRVLYDRRHIYFGVLCRDSNGAGIRATELRRDNELENDDIFEIILDTLHDRRNGYLFRINALGTQYDATVTNEGETTNRNWDENWESQARIVENGWSAEVAIPFKAVRFISGDRITWGVNFHRTIKQKNEDVFWAAHNRDYSFEEVSRAGRLEGLSDILGFRYRIKPYFTTGASKALRAGAYDTKHLTSVGIEDAKYMITPQLAMDLTVNPDFAQAEVDEVQVNLTRFSLFFPERREFFQEGSGIFAFGTGQGQFNGRPQALLFHSRRIGLSETREEIPIYGGVKLTGKQGRFDMGLLNMQTGRFDEEAGQNFTVARVKANLLARSYIGGIFTRNTAGAIGDRNLTAGIDASFTFLRNLNIRGFLAKSDSRQLAGNEWAGQAKIEWDSDRFGYELEHVVLQENFLPPMGFIARPNSKRTYAQAAYKPRPKIPWVRQMEFVGDLEYVTDQHGDLETRITEFGFETNLTSGDSLEFEYSRRFERLVEPFDVEDGQIIPRGDYQFAVFSATFRPYEGRAISGDFDFEAGGFYNGKIVSLELSPQIKVTQELSFDVAYEWNRISLPAHPSFSTQAFNGAVNYAFSRKWLTKTTVLLNSQDSQYAFNFRLNHIFRPGDDVFVVYNESRNYGSQALQNRLQNRALILKVTFSLDR